MYQIKITRKSAVLYLQKEFGTKRAVQLLKELNTSGFLTLPVLPFGKLKTKAMAEKTLNHVKMIVFYQQGRLNKNLTDPCVYID